MINNPEIVEVPNASRGGSETTFKPVHMLEVEIGAPLPSLSAVNEKTGNIYQRARVLIRLHTHPLGIIEIDLQGEQLPPEDYVEHIWRSLACKINQHLKEDGLPEITSLGIEGLASVTQPACLHRRQKILSTAPFVSVVVCTRDRADVLGTCIDSLLLLDYPNFEILIIDNAPATSATADLVQQRYQHHPHVRYVREDRPGLTNARNTSLAHARGEIIAYTDDDAIVDRYWLVELMRGFSESSNVACVTGLTLPLEQENQVQDWFEQFGGFNRLESYTYRKFDLCDLPRRRADDPLYPYLTYKFGAGVNQAYRVSTIRKLGGFDRALGPGTPGRGGEESEAYFRLIMNGYTIIANPSAIVRHLHRRDYLGLRKQLYDYGVGFTAYLTRSILDDPRRLIFLVGKVPYGVRYLLSTRSPKHAQKRTDFPRDLAWVEMQGMLSGPFAYLKGRWRV